LSFYELFCVCELFFVFFRTFCWSCGFSYLLLVLRLFLLLDNLLKFFVGFWFSSCASWGLRFKLQIL
jgi:hypothetical protein